MQTNNFTFPTEQLDQCRAALKANDPIRANRSTCRLLGAYLALRDLVRTGQPDLSDYVHACLEAHAEAVALIEGQLH